MNHQWHYDRLIERARGRVIDGYTERHHVMPKCLGGDNSKSNVVRLTAEEHSVAHALLIRIYPGNLGLLAAAMFMEGGGSHPRKGNKVYGWVRREFAAALSAHKRGVPRSAETCAKIRESKIGSVISPEHRAKLSAAGKGRKQTAEDRAKKSAARLGQKHSAETIAKLTGRKVTAEGRLRMSEAARNRKISPEGRAKLSAARMGKRVLPIGYRHSPEARAKMSDARKGRPMSDEHKAKIRASRLAYLAKRTVDETGQPRKVA